MKIAPAMGEDYIGREDFLEFLEAFFDRGAEIGKKSVSKGFYDDSLLARSREERVGAASGFHGPFRVSTQNEPIELDSVRLLDEAKDRSPTSDLDVVAVCPQAQHPLHASEIARNHFVISY